MSEEMQSNNTIKRKNVSLELDKYKSVAFKNVGEICIMAVTDLNEMEKEISKIPQLENEKQQLQQQAVQLRELQEAAHLRAERLANEKRIIENENVNLRNEKVELEREKIRLEESYKALNSEYMKLKVFKENAGRGRQNVLTPEQVGLIRQQKIEGWSVRQIHTSLEDMGVEVSYETVRKVVAEMTPPTPPKAKMKYFDMEIVEEEIVDVPPIEPIIEPKITSDPLGDDGYAKLDKLLKGMGMDGVEPPKSNLFGTAATEPTDAEKNSGRFISTDFKTRD